MSIALGALAAVLAAAAAAIAVTTLSPRRREVAAALARAGGYGRQAPPAAGAPQRPSRVLVLARLGVLLTPPGARAGAVARLRAAGSRRFSDDAYFAFKAALGGGVFALVAGLELASSTSPAVAFLLAATLGALGFLLPDVALGAKARARRDRALRDLPNALDLLAVSVEAGLGLDGAMARYAETAEGPLAEELGLVVTELRVGAEREQVLRRFAERVPTAETRSFVRAVAQADRLGASVGATLRTQAREARFRRTAAAEEKANRIPVKMLFPTVFCIFPALFVVVLGPPLINLLDVL